MSTLLNVLISSEKVFTKESVVFFQSENWTSDSELQLLQKVHEIVSIVRPFGKTLNLNIEIEVEDTTVVMKLIQSNSRKAEQLNTQKLSKREIEIVGLLMQGFASEEIAEKLFICFETVKSHRKHILEKTGAKNTAALINYYHQTFFEK